MSDLLASASASETSANGDSNRDSSATRDEQEQEEELAFGPTPAYSLSKAAANAAVRTWAPRLLRPPPATAPTSGSSGGVRLVAVCPGDVLTRMTSAVSAAVYSRINLDSFAPSVAVTISLESPIG